VGNSQTCIQNAINYLNGIGGGEIFIEAGTYICSSTITLYSNIKIFGEGIFTKLINSVASDSYLLKAEGTSASPLFNISLQDLYNNNLG
jgi:hypothetical protein